jgi:hypothetical protein
MPTLKTGGTTSIPANSDDIERPELTGHSACPVRISSIIFDSPHLLIKHPQFRFANFTGHFHLSGEFSV